MTPRMAVEYTIVCTGTDAEHHRRLEIVRLRDYGEFDRRLRADDLEALIARGPEGAAPPDRQEWLAAAATRGGLDALRNTVRTDDSGRGRVITRRADVARVRPDGKLTYSLKCSRCLQSLPPLHEQTLRALLESAGDTQVELKQLASRVR